MGDQRGKAPQDKVRGSRPLQLEIGHAGLDAAERLLVELYSLWLNSWQS